MRKHVRTALIMLLLGTLTSAASVILIAYWPRTSLNEARFERVDRDRDQSKGEGRGFLSTWYGTGLGFQIASGTASQQFILGGYNYGTNTKQLSWPSAMAELAVPWLTGAEPWPIDGVHRQVRVLRVGWPLPMLEGEWSQTISRPRPLPVGDVNLDAPSGGQNVITTAHWIRTRTMWSPFGGWAYMNSPNWLRSSRLGSVLFNKVHLEAVPTRPLWVGVVLNTVFFGACWWVTLAALGRARRAIREARSRGRCPQCGYSRVGLTSDAPCPECGKRPGRDSNPRPAV